MKKLLYLVMAAMVLLACNSNDPKIDKKDNKMLKEASQNVLGQLGQKRSTVIKAFNDLGFIDGSQYDMAFAPARKGMPAAKKDGSDIFFYYAGTQKEAFIAACEEHSEQALMRVVNKILEDKSVFGLVGVDFDSNGKCISIGGEFMSNQEVKNIHNLYLNCSKNIFLSLDEKKEWQGTLFEYDDFINKNKDATTEYSKASERDKFEEDFAKLEIPCAEEGGSDQFSSTQNRTYNLSYFGDGDGIIEMPVMYPVVVCIIEAELVEP